MYNEAKLFFSITELGCAVNAISFMDTACSGRQTCEYVVVGTDLGKTNPCPQELPYLEVEYLCVEGNTFPNIFAITVWIEHYTSSLPVWLGFLNLNGMLRYHNED